MTTVAKNPGDLLGERKLRNIRVAAIAANPNQPRKAFKGIEELAESIKVNGLLQPVTVRANGDLTFIIIAGERRFRAVSSLGWTTIPAIVIEQEEAAAYTLSVLENMARKDMTPVEEARALKQLLETMTPPEVSSAIGYGDVNDGNQVIWKVKLLDAIEEVQELVNLGHLNQTKAIQMSKLSRNGQLRVLKAAGSEKLNDREWGALVETIFSEENQLDMFPETKLDPEVIRERNELAEALEAMRRATTKMAKLRIDVITRGNRQAAVSVNQQLEEAIRTLSRVNREVQSEAGRALAFGEGEVQPL